MRKRSLILEDKLNLILVGESGVGKTSLLNQYTKGIFHSQVIATVGNALVNQALNTFPRKNVLKGKR